MWTGWFDRASTANLVRIYLAVPEADKPAGAIHHPLIMGGKQKGDPVVLVELLHDVQQGLKEQLSG